MKSSPEQPKTLPDLHLVSHKDIASETSARTPEDASENLIATVVDIRRFSTHDGDGLRTTVFLKGCPLACAWCQNPETISPRINPVFFRNKCIDCRLCVECSQNNEATVREDGTVNVHVGRVGDWQQLIDVCPTGAIRWDAQNYPLSELIGLVLRDKPFFREGGGVTLSGGEPLFKPRVAIEFLRQLQELGVNTAIETALHVAQRYLAEAAEYCNTIFADFKVFDSDAHVKDVGCGNALIMANIEYLLTSAHRKKTIVRTPLIPGFTTNEKNIRAIGQFISDLYPEVKWELLNYNPLAAGKYEHTPDLTFAFAGSENPPIYTSEEMEAFRDLARQSGVVHIIGP